MDHLKLLYIDSLTALSVLYAYLVLFVLLLTRIVVIW